MKLRIISSYSLECLKTRINNQIVEYHIKAQQYLDEANRMESHDPKSGRVISLRQEAAQYQYRIEGLREGLNNISLYESEIKICLKKKSS